MKPVFRILLVALLLNTTTTAQETFQKIYPELSGSIESVIETDDGYYFTSLEKLSKIDFSGNLLWSKSIKPTIFFYDNFNKVVIKGAGEYTIIEKGGIIDSLFFLSQYDSDSNLLWSTAITDTNATHFTLKASRNGSIYVSYQSSPDENNFNFIVLHKISAEGIELWKHNISQASIGFIQMTTINELSTNEIIFSYRRLLYKIDENGDALDTTTNSFGRSIEKVDLLDNDQIIVKLQNEFYVSFTSQFEELWRTSNELSENFVTAGNYFFTFDFYGKTINQFDANGSLINTFEINQNIEQIKSASQSRFIITGNKQVGGFSSPCLSVINRDGTIQKFLDLYYPNNDKVYSTFDNINIGWLSSQVENVDLFYSTDSGNEWLTIATNVSASENSYHWEGLYENISSLLIKVQESGNSSFFDVTPEPIQVQIYDAYNYIAANEIFMWVGNNGLGSHNPVTDDSGFFWPGGENATKPLIFQDGLVWGGIIEGELKANGSYYRQGLQPGSILPDGSADNPLSSRNKIYKIKAGWENLPESRAKHSYKYDYENWTVDLGAPWIDENNDGIYTIGVDKPKIIGSETLFYVANDLDTIISKSSYGSDPIGLEFRTLVYGSSDKERENFVIKDYTIINKSGKFINDMYIGYWADDDLGFAGDDFAGCDSSLNLMYTFNGDNYDDENFLSFIPTVGHMLIKGPDDNNNSALEMGALINIIKGEAYMGDPYLGEYTGTEYLYNYLKGLDNYGNPITDPSTGKVTNYMYSGDPVNSTGWFMGGDADSLQNLRPGDRRFVMSSGPFDFAPDDTQRVVIAILVARGETVNEGIVELKNYAAYIKSLWNDDQLTNVQSTNESLKIPETYSLSQNYPNPFNPTTMIEYTIPSSVMLNSFQHQDTEIRQLTDDFAKVRLVIYDILGREVATLVNTKQKPGSYKVEWDASQHASGIYFYELRTNDFVKTNKMILIK